MEQRRAEGIVNIPEDAIADGPWVVTLENLLSDEECDRLVQLGHNEGYERSMDVGAKRFDGTFDAHENPRRTSTNAWCSGDCFDDPMVQEITNRLEQLTGIPSNHSEYWQLLRYEETQEYNEHHDYITYQVDRSEGVRILTVYFYLNDVEAGGGTRFPKLNLTVYPAKGRALIWPSTNNVNPDTKDPRTNHQALPVGAFSRIVLLVFVVRHTVSLPAHYYFLSFSVLLCFRFDRKGNQIRGQRMDSSTRLQNAAPRELPVTNDIINLHKSKATEASRVDPTYGTPSYLDLDSML